MSYAGTYDPTPVPEPRKKPKLKVDLQCGHQVFADPWWMSDPLYGGWRCPSYAYCRECEDQVSVRRESWPPVRRAAATGGGS